MSENYLGALYLRAVKEQTVEALEILHDYCYESGLPAYAIKALQDMIPKHVLREKQHERVSKAAPPVGKRTIHLTREAAWLLCKETLSIQEFQEAISLGSTRYRSSSQGLPNPEFSLCSLSPYGYGQIPQTIGEIASVTCKPCLAMLGKLDALMAGYEPSVRGRVPAIHWNRDHDPDYSSTAATPCGFAVPVTCTSQDLSKVTCKSCSKYHRAGVAKKSAPVPSVKPPALPKVEAIHWFGVKDGVVLSTSKTACGRFPKCPETAGLSSVSLWTTDPTKVTCEVCLTKATQALKEFEAVPYV